MGRKSGSGGARVAIPGAVYPQRTDLAARTPPAFKGQQYGAGVAQQAQVAAAAPAIAQNAAVGAPPAAPGAPGAPQVPFAGGQHPVPPGVAAPGQFPPLLAPTTRPNEPVTAGMPFGPGPNGPAPTFTPDPMMGSLALLNSIPASHMTPQLQALAAASAASVANSTKPGMVPPNG